MVAILFFIQARDLRIYRDIKFTKKIGPAGNASEGSFLNKVIIYIPVENEVDLRKIIFSGSIFLQQIFLIFVEKFQQKTLPLFFGFVGSHNYFRFL